MKNTSILLCSIASSVLLTALNANAHPYASGVTNSGGTIEFILNESASAVTVTFDDGAATESLGALSKGLNSFSLGGHTKFAIAVYKEGTGAFTQLSSDSSNAVQFVAPRSVGVNVNPQRPTFGRIYVCSSWPSGVPEPIDGTSPQTEVTGNGRSVGKGIYLLNQDMSDAIGQGTNALLGNIWLGTSPRYSPFRVVVGPDDSVYVADCAGSYTASLSPPSAGGGLSYSLPGGGVWWASPDFSSTTNLFDTNLQSTVFDGVIGLAVSGSIAANNLVITATEWSESGDTLTGAFLTPPAVWQYAYDAVNNPIPISNDPYGLLTVGLGINGVLGDLAIHPTKGYIYAQQDRTSPAGDPAAGTGEANNNNAELYVYDSSGATNLWESGIGGANVYPATYGIAVSPDGNWLACATGFGTTIITHITNGIPDLSTMVTNNEEAGPINTGLVSERRGVVFDLADNLITTLPAYTGSGYEVPTSTTPAVVREYSLGYTSLATTSNDSTCTNGSFSLVLTPPAPAPATITSVSAVGSSVTLTWSAPGSATTASFTVQSAASLSGPWADVTPAPTITQPGGAGTAFQATVTASGPTTFYRIDQL